MLAPEGIDLLQHKKSFCFAHQAGTHLIHLAFLDVIGITQLLLQKGLEFIDGKSLKLLGLQILEQIDKFLNLVQKAGQVPFFRGQIGVDISINNFIDSLFAKFNDL